MLNNKSIIIWIDKNIFNEENSEYVEQLKKFEDDFDIFTFKEVDDGFNKIKEIKFNNTYIILSGRIYKDFIFKYKNELSDFSVIPKILIFTGSVENFKNYNKDIQNIYEEPFYNLGGIQIRFSEVKQFIINNNNNLKIPLKNENIKFLIEKIDNIEKLYLPTFYRALIKNNSSYNFSDFSNFLYEKCLKNEKIIELFSQIKEFKKIPNEILCKYYLKAYLSDNDFQNEINKSLLEENCEKFVPFIKMMYEGVKLNSFQCTTEKNLYYTSNMNINDINFIKDNINNNKIEGIPNLIITSQTFVSFTIDKIRVEKSIKNNKENEISVLFELEKNLETNNNLNSHCNILNNKEVLFFPFSTFGIKNIEEKEINSIKTFQITLNYLSQYEYNLDKEKKNIKIDNIIPSTVFKEKIIKCILNEYKETPLTYKIMYENLKFFKNEINCEYNIEEKDLGQQIQILNCYEEAKKKYINIIGENNENELREKCILYINGVKIDFCFKYIFLKKGINHLKIKFKKPLTNACCLFHKCLQMTSIDCSNFFSNELKNISRMFIITIFKFI